MSRCNVMCVLPYIHSGNSVNSPLVGRLRREWRVWPLMLRAAVPVGTAITSWYMYVLQLRL